ncbi:MAG: hypothetical protein UY16_C0018G0002 [Candidatus Gottesmanbacteria bacterium GW2011_GWA2_47_9]|uniref:5-formyltetrahydrofolate cyclo-ligase n=2 Tax=Candidatus Gottesmaniibacteriota TaxID=1752720 RepID=A0A0G1U124_9BACT|nr:MAG: hypothetical protein UY16_C0018G0002 [Candidatus Gottesmanbacteria bacterium GW2011_GWA2_47_9]
MQKEDVRNEMGQKRRAMAMAVRRGADSRIVRKLLARREIGLANIICAYVSTSEEVDTKEIIIHLLRQGKQVVVPKAEGNELTVYRIKSVDDLVPGGFGILEPKDNCQHADVSMIDVFIVPGIAFDRQGYRLGWGKGYYDRLLARVTVPKIGLAYATQIVSGLPHESYDIQMDVVITQEKTYGKKEQSDTSRISIFGFDG